MAASAGRLSAHSVHNRLGKRSDASLREKRLSEDSSHHQLLQKWESVWSVGAAEAERLEEKAAAEPPLVFLCTRCRRPLGDSLTWVASQEDTSCILLRGQLGPPPRGEREGFLGAVRVGDVPVGGSRPCGPRLG